VTLEAKATKTLPPGLKRQSVCTAHRTKQAARQHYVMATAHVSSLCHGECFLLAALLAMCISLPYYAVGHNVGAAQRAIGQPGRALLTDDMLAVEDHVLRPLAQADRALVAVLACIATAIVGADLGAAAVFATAA
jgi:hypothetical protein